MKLAVDGSYKAWSWVRPAFPLRMTSRRKRISSALILWEVQSWPESLDKVSSCV